MSIPKNPYPGIRPFREADSNNFFGREHLTADLVSKLEHNRFVSVVGVSGCGKSSLIQAGLIPFVKKSGWTIVTTRPQNNPIGNLATQLGGLDFVEHGNLENLKDTWQRMIPSTLTLSSYGIIDTYEQTHSQKKLLIIVDQFEELFQFKQKGEQERETALKFVRLLIEAANQKDLPIHILVVMRADFLGFCAQFKGLPELINAGQFLIPRLTRDQYREAITNPLGRLGIAIAPNVVSQLLNDIEDDPDQLPILQHALMLTYEHWRSEDSKHPTITLDNYNASGGMAHAINLHCNQIFDRLKANQLDVATIKIFKRLTQINLEGIPVRSPATLEELINITGHDHDAVIDILDSFRDDGRNFLFPAIATKIDINTVIDLSHECIIRKWTLLSKWVMEEEQDKRDLTKLVEHFLNYKANERGLLKGLTLSNYLNWSPYVESSQPNTGIWARRYTRLFADAVQFIDKSKKLTVQSRRVRRLSTLCILALSLLMIGYYYNELHEHRLAQKDEALKNAEIHTADTLNKLVKQFEEGEGDSSIYIRNISLQKDKNALHMRLLEEQSRREKLSKTLDSITLVLTAIKKRRYRSEEAQALSDQKMENLIAVQQAQSSALESAKSQRDELLKEKARLNVQIGTLSNSLSKEEQLKEYFANLFAEELKKNGRLLEEFEKRLQQDIKENSVSSDLVSSLSNYVTEQKKKLGLILGQISHDHRIFVYTKHENSDQQINEFTKLLKTNGYDGRVVRKPSNKVFFNSTGITILAADNVLYEKLKLFINNTPLKGKKINDNAQNKELRLISPNNSTTVIVLDY